MNKKCIGCGAVLQTYDTKAVGYVKEANLEKSLLCERCFRIRNYNDYQVVNKDNQEFVDILKEIDKTKDLVVLVVDVFSLSHQLEQIGKMLSNPILLVLSKRDILPEKIYEQKIIDYIDKFHLSVVDKVFISSNKNYHLDELLGSIHQYKVSNRVYVVGFTNAGKSTLINKLLYNYSDKDTMITTSLLPSTTLDTLEIVLDESLTLIDTPGLLEEGNIVNLVNGKDLKKIVPTKRMKPITYQIKNRQYIIIDDYAVLECLEPTNITLFVSGNLKIKRQYQFTQESNYHQTELHVEAGKDIVLLGLGFIKVSKKAKFKVYMSTPTNVYVRDSLI